MISKPFNLLQFLCLLLLSLLVSCEPPGEVQRYLTVSSPTVTWHQRFLDLFVILSRSRSTLLWKRYWWRITGTASRSDLKDWPQGLTSRPIKRLAFTWNIQHPQSWRVHRVPVSEGSEDPGQWQQQPRDLQDHGGGVGGTVGLPLQLLVLLQRQHGPEHLGQAEGADAHLIKSS